MNQNWNHFVTHRIARTARELATAAGMLLVLATGVFSQGVNVLPPQQDPPPGQESLSQDSPSDVPFGGSPLVEPWQQSDVHVGGGCTDCGSGPACTGCGIYSYGNCAACGPPGPLSCLSGLLQHVQPSDRCFSEFVSPITNPIFFEDPRTLTEARVLFINHDLPDALGGGDAQVYALQLRAALTDRLSLIAIKDGFIVGQPNAPHDDGWADIGIGLKYLLWSDCCRQQLLAGGVTYELPTGSQRALQGNGDGEFNAFLSAGSRLWNCWNWMGAAGARIPTNSNEESQVFYYSNHLSRRLGNSNLFLVSEANWYHWLRSGNQTALAGIEGVDLYNFGSTGVAGNNIVTGAWGVRYKPGPSTEIGLAYEVPWTNREDVFDDRVTLDWIFRY